MGTRTKVLITLALVGAGAVLTLPSAASAVRSGVTIHLFVGDTLKGFVFSPKPRQCADGRTVNLFRQKGKKQNPKRDIKVAKTQAARRSNGKYRWEVSLHRPRPGDYYAQVPASAICQADNSKAAHISVRPQTKIDIASPGESTAFFHFYAVGGIAPYRFRCKLDDQRYRHCPGFQKNYRHVSRGDHVFKVFAIGDNGKRDPTPAKKSFHVPS
jgi:hypothetical protein